MVLKVLKKFQRYIQKKQDYSHIEDDMDTHSQRSNTSNFRGSTRPLTLLPLIAMIFYGVSGGPFGSEDAVQAGGGLLAILGFLIFPLIWSVPEALVTAELATMFPENSGYVVWVSSAFGEFWGFQEGIWSWFSGVTDNSIYPALFTYYLQLYIPKLNQWGYRLSFTACITVILAYFNYRGIQFVGRSAQYMALFVLAPFILMSFIAIPMIDIRGWVQVDLKTVDWNKYLNILFWNLNYWDNVSTLAGEVKNPSKNFPRAMMGALFLVVTSYLIPIMVGLGVQPDTSKWHTGYFSNIAQMVGGTWLSIFILMSSAISQLGQFNAEMSSDAFLLQGMAERGLLPQVLAHRSKYGTPTLGIILSSMGILVITTLDLVKVIEMLNIMYCLSELLEFGAFIWLRFNYTQINRPYRVKLSSWGCVFMLLPGMALLVYVILIPFVYLQYDLIITTMSAIVIGLIMYPFLKYLKARKLCGFIENEQEPMEVLESIREEEENEQQDAMQTQNSMENYDVVIEDQKLRMVRQGSHLRDEIWSQSSVNRGDLISQSFNTGGIAKNSEEYSRPALGRRSDVV